MTMIDPTLVGWQIGHLPEKEDELCLRTFD